MGTQKGIESFSKKKLNPLGSHNEMMTAVVHSQTADEWMSKADLNEIVVVWLKGSFPYAVAKVVEIVSARQIKVHWMGPKTKTEEEPDFFTDPIHFQWELDNGVIVTSKKQPMGSKEYLQIIWRENIAEDDPINKTVLGPTGCLRKNVAESCLASTLYNHWKEKTNKKSTRKSAARKPRAKVQSKKKGKPGTKRKKADSDDEPLIKKKKKDSDDDDSE